jgi:hypothetical protein
MVRVQNLFHHIYHDPNESLEDSSQAYKASASPSMLIWNKVGDIRFELLLIAPNDVCYLFTPYLQKQKPSVETEGCCQTKKQIYNLKTEQRIQPSPIPVGHWGHVNHVCCTLFIRQM